MMTPEQAREWAEQAKRDGWVTEEDRVGRAGDGRTASHYVEAYRWRGYLDAPEGRWIAHASYDITTGGYRGGEAHMWGPDRLAVTLPVPYAHPTPALLRVCGNCGAMDVETHRVGFAGRCCAVCLPAMKREHEYPGWTN